MIDKNHRKKGSGKAAMRLAPDFIRTWPCGEAEMRIDTMKKIGFPHFWGSSWRSSARAAGLGLAFTVINPYSGNGLELLRQALSAEILLGAVLLHIVKSVFWIGLAALVPGKKEAR